MTRDQALAKIKKCMALGRSAEPHEAAAAMRQAQKLMAEFAVNDHELSFIDVSEVRIRATSSAGNAWEVALVGIVAKAFGCERFGVVESHFNAASVLIRHRYNVFVGLDAAPTLAGYTYEVLSRQCARARLEHIRKQPKRCKPITKTARGDAFAFGWVAAVQSLVERFAQPEATKALLVSYVETRHPDLKKVEPRDTTQGRKVDWGHDAAGFRAGKSAQLNRAVGAFVPRGLLT